MFECAWGDRRDCELWARELILCDSCHADFGSYCPDHWGMPDGSLPDYPLRIVRDVEKPAIAQDRYGPTCQHRLALLLFRHHALVRSASAPSSR